METCITRILIIWLCVLIAEACCAADDTKLRVRRISGQAELGTVEIHGVGAGDFDPGLWRTGKLHFVADARSPVLEPLKRGVFRNIYAPSAVEVEDGWRVFYGAWDGVDTGNDRIYSVFTRDFLDFSDRHTVIDHGVFVHVCNVNALRLPGGEWRVMCTAYPDSRGLNKPALFTSPDGARWNGGPAPYPAGMADLVDMAGYDKFADADMNGMNVILYEDGMHRLYFNNFKDWGRVFRATSSDGKSFTYDGVALEFGACVNDVKKLTFGGAFWYLMGLHFNGDTLWYSLSNDGVKFEPPIELARNLGEKDRYIVAHGWVTRGNRVLGFLYGAGESSSLDRNRIWARWLQRKVSFVSDDGERYEPSAALGPDRQVLTVPRDREIRGNFRILGEDGTTVIAESCPGALVSGAVYVVE